MSRDIITKDTSGHEVRVWQDLGYKEPALMIWTTTKDDKFTAPRINIQQAILLRNSLEDFIYKYTRVPTKDDLIKQLKSAERTLQLKELEISDMHSMLDSMNAPNCKLGARTDHRAKWYNKEVSQIVSNISNELENLEGSMNKLKKHTHGEGS